ncbi:acetyltransferase, partial [Mariniblastus sp.]|nr:acetyltransferase [Mariniblastus sp.]
MKNSFWCPCRICIYGYGGHAKVIADTYISPDSEVAYFYEDDLSLLSENKISVKPGLTYGDQGFEIPLIPLVIGVGKNRIRQNIANSLNSFNARYAVATHPSANISDTATIGDGSVIFSNAVIQVGTEVGMHVIINTSASIDHECKISDFAHISPNATLCGNVTVGEGA